MSPEAQRIAIAEACGWVFMDGGKFAGTDYKSVKPPYGLSYTMTHDAAIRSTPDYLNDLNAMHEAEKALTYAQGGQMTVWIERMNCAGYGPQLFATAAQRAEAFLRTLGKWEEGA